MKKIKNLVIIAIFLSLVLMFIETLVKKESFYESYGVNPLTFTLLLITSEIAFNVGIVIMLVASGVFRLSLKQIFSFDFKGITFKSKWFFLGFILNRLSAIVPWGYLLYYGWGKLPIVTTILLLSEIIIVLVLAYGVVELIMKKVRIRKATYNDIPGIIVVEKLAWGEEGAATAKQFENRINTFSEGTLVAEYEDRIIGVLASQLLSDTDLKKDGISWANLTDNGNIINSHKPEGNCLFGIDLSVDPSFQNKGVGRKLLMGIGKLAIRKNLKYGVLGARMPDYHKYSKLKNPEEYIRWRDEEGQLIDTELRFYEKSGVQLRRVVRDYFPDKESLNYGVICYWANPFYLRNKILGRFLGKILSFMFKI